jgi:hypothetical protein
MMMVGRTPILDRPQQVSVSVVGEGSVTSMPMGIDCEPTCTADFEPMSTVTLTANPDAMSVFEEWGGDCSGSGTCSLVIDGPKNVSARFSLHGAVRWVNQVSFTGNDLIDDIAVDQDGNVIVAGTASPGDESDIFVAKYSPATGDTVWMQHFATLNPAAFETWGDMALDASGNVYVTGGIQGNGTTVTFAPGHTAVGDVFQNILVMRLSGTDGSIEWVRTWGGSSVDRGTAIAVSGADVYVAGNTSSVPSNFDSQSINGQTGQGFLARASATDGACAQVRTIPGTVDLNALAVDGNNVLLGGNVRSALSLGGCGVTPTATGNDGLLAMFTGSNLGCTWAKNFGSNTSGEDTLVNAVAAFPNGGGWAVVGRFRGSLGGLTSGSVGSMGGFDAYAAHLAIDGTHQWSFHYGGAGDETASSVATTPAGNVVFAGAFVDSITFGSHTVTGTQDAYVTRMSSAAIPTHEWAVSLGGSEADAALDVATAADGTVVVTSSFSGMTTVGTESLASQQIDNWVASLVR